MIVWGADKTWLMHGDCVQVMRGFAENTFDSIVCDPPYLLGFMAKHWDREESLRHEEWAREALRVLKPGGHIVAFGGSRTYHRLACALEDVGFEIRDSLMWLYGTGFPKSLNVGKVLDDPTRHHEDCPVRHGASVDCVPGWECEARRVAERVAGLGTALKPAFEPIVLARKALDGTVAANVAKWGTGALNIDATRIGKSGGSQTPSGMDRFNAANAAQGYRPASYTQGPPPVPKDAGRWPANVMLDEEAAAMLDAQADASRFFYCAKTSRAEREEGLAHLPPKTAVEAVGRDPESAGAKNPRAGAGRGAGASRKKCVKCGLNVDGGRAVEECREGGEHSIVADEARGAVRNHHPTVKPVALMRWLVRLVTPLGGFVLDPFVGSGSTGMASVREGMRFVGIDREGEYLTIAASRIWHTMNTPEER